MFVGTGSMAACNTDRWYFTREQLINSPSRKCQIEPERELSYRQHAANLIQDMGQRLQVNQLCINTAIVYMHRFYVFHSFSKFQRNSIAAAALFLAAKVEEQPHKLEYVIKVHHACLHRGGPVLDTKSEAYLQQAQELVINESILLQTLGFEVAVDHPHTHVVKCTQMIRASKDLAQTSYFMATNSLHLTTFCLQYKPTLVACVCIYLVAKWSQWEIMKSSDGKDWWEYVDPTVTKDLLDELTKEFLRIFEACPSRLKRRISNEKIPVMPHQSKRSRLKEGASESQSSSTAKTTAASSASTSSVDSGLPGSNSFDSFMNSQDTNSASQGDGQGSSAGGDTETDRPELFAINMGLPMVESSLFSLDSEYMGSTGYNVNPGSDSKHGLPGSQSDSEYGKMGDQQGHPVKVSLKEYREQKERERIKTAKQIGSSKEGAPPRTSHTVSRPSSQNLSGVKGNVNSPHTDAQRSREKYHSQGSQKHRPDDKKAERQSGTPLEPSGNPHTKAPGRPPDLKHARDQRQHSQQRPNDLEVHAARGATVAESRYSKNSDQYHKPHQEPSKNNSDRKQLLGPNSQEKEHKRNGFESKEHGANSRPPEGVPKIPSSVAPSKSHGLGSQKHHHLETQKAHSSVKLQTTEPVVKQNPETLRPVKSETHRSQRSENQVIQRSEKHRVPHPDMAKLHKSQSLKPQRFETPKAPSIEKHLSQPAVPPLVPLSYVGQEQKVSNLPTQKVEPPLPIDHELPKPQRPERVLLPQTETVKVEKSSTPALNRHNMTKPHKSEDPHLQRPEVLKVPKSETGAVIKTEPAKVKSPGSSKLKAPKATKVKGPELAKVQKSVGHKPQKTETLRLSKTDSQFTPNNELLKRLRTDTSEMTSKLKPNVLPSKMVKQEPQIPPTPVVNLPVVNSPVVKAEKPDAPRTQKLNQPQPPKPDPSKRQRLKMEPGLSHRQTTPKSQIPPLATPVKLEKSPPPEPMSPLSPQPKLKVLEMAVLQADLNIKTEILDTAASSSKAAIRRKPQTPPSAKLENPLEKMGMPSSLKPVTPKQSDISYSYIPDKANSQRAETVTPLKADTDKQHKPLTPKSQKSTTPRSRASPGASSQASKPSKAAVSETPKVAHAGGTSDKKVVWETIKPLEVLISGGSDQAPDSESVETDIDELINADIAALSKKQGFEPPSLLEPKPQFLEENTVEPKEKKKERDESSLPKSYREKESHHRKRHSDEHRSKSSSHKHHRSSDHNRRGTPNTDAIPSPAEQAPTTDAAGDSQPHSILTTSTGIRLKIKGLSSSMNSGSSNNAKVESPSDRRQTGSPALLLKLNLTKMQANSDHPPETEITPDRERGSSHRQHHHHHRKHKHHHKSRSQRRVEDSGEPHRRKRSHSRSDSVSSGREESPAISSPAKKRAHGAERYLKSQSILPDAQSLLRFPMPPSDPNQPTAPGYMDYNNKRSHVMLQDNSPSLASTGQFSYNTSGLLPNAPLTTVTALPSSDGFSFYPYSQPPSDGHLPPPPPPLPREDIPPPPPPPM